MTSCTCNWGDIATATPCLKHGMVGETIKNEPCKTAPLFSPNERMCYTLWTSPTSLAGTSSASMGTVDDMVENSTAAATLRSDTD